VEQVGVLWKSICSRLASGSLEDLNMQHMEKPSWKSAAGVAQQLQCYALLGLLDLVLASELRQLPYSVDVSSAADRLDSILGSRERLQTWLLGASRPKTFTGGLAAVWLASDGSICHFRLGHCVGGL
jgi:hypothetical protein